MSRIFAYARVSTFEQNTENQIHEIRNHGFKVQSHRVITETISGSVQVSRRPEFKRLFDKLEKGDVLVVTKLDRLGRDAIDVASSVEKLEQCGIKVHCLALGGVDLTSSSGKLTMGVINAVAQFERDLLIERTQAGLERARREGKTLGRPKVLNEAQRAGVLDRLQKGESVSSISRHYNTSRQTIMRVRGMQVRDGA